MQNHIGRDLKQDIRDEEDQENDRVLVRSDAQVFLHPARCGVGDVGSVKVGERIEDPYGGDLLKSEAMIWVDEGRQGRPCDMEVDFTYQPALDYGSDLITVLLELTRRILAFASIHCV